MPKVALVTDSTASLTREAVERYGIIVVPLQVVIGAHSYEDGVDPEVGPDVVVAALREWVPVSTSRPSPAAMLEAYEQAAALGAEEIVSVHLSGDMSSTFESAMLAAKESPVPVVPVDTRLVGAGVGFAVLAAAAVIEAGGSAADAAIAAADRAERTRSLFYVDTLEYLRRGGRVGSAAALVGSALSVKPLLEIRDGRIGTLEKVRTSGRALSRLEELAVAAAGEDQVEVAVAHLANGARAEQLAANLGRRLEANLGGRAVVVGEVSAVLGVHTGPGVVGVVVTPAQAE